MFSINALGTYADFRVFRSLFPMGTLSVDTPVCELSTFKVSASGRTQGVSPAYGGVGRVPPVFFTSDVALCKSISRWYLAKILAQRTTTKKRRGYVCCPFPLSNALPLPNSIEQKTFKTWILKKRFQRVSNTASSKRLCLCLWTTFPTHSPLHAAFSHTIQPHSARRRQPCLCNPEEHVPPGSSSDTRLFCSPLQI